LWQVFLNIEAIKAKFADDVRGLVKVFRATAEDLRHDWAFRRRIQEVAKDTLTAAPKSLNIRKLGQHHIRPSIQPVHCPARRIRYAIHGCKPNNRL
jgi:hypothetical protein